MINCISGVIKNMSSHKTYNTKIELLNAVRDKRSMRGNTKVRSLRVLCGKGSG
jgi:hypothetical protein